jgi:hypothetical protein
MDRTGDGIQRGAGTGNRGTEQPARPGNRATRSVTPSLFDEVDDPLEPSPVAAPPVAPPGPPTPNAPPTLSAGEKTKARDILAAIRTLQHVERENPAVLVLAEADAELQRLGVLKRNHADEQYLARRKLRELPDHIERLDERREALTADRRVISGGDPGTLVTGGRPVPLAAAPAALTRALERIPETADRTFPLGTYRGLSFGIAYHWGSADVYLSGRTELRAPLSRESRGARAVLNALNRIVDSYDERIEANARELELMRSQLRDYEARIGRAFAHSTHLSELTDLRDRLKTALSGTPAEGEQTAAELAAKIRALMASHTVESAPARVRDKPVIERVRKREQPAPPSPPDAPMQTPEETKPESGTPDDQEEAPGGFRAQVGRKVQRPLF